MKIQQYFHIPVILVITVIYLLGVASVPFHPDETTQIFMSGDADIFLRSPSELLYTEDPTDALRQNYRLLDTPLTRWLISVGRAITGEPPLTADWDWSKTWLENQQQGAFPSEKLLLAARLSVAWLFALTLYFSFKAGVRIRNAALGWVLILFITVNGLVLLHTRRAMAESVLLFSTSWLIYALAKKEFNPFLLAIPAALAINSKQTAAVLAIMAVAAAWVYTNRPSIRLRFRNSLVCLAVIIFMTYVLNPVAWNRPFAALQAAVEARSTLAAEQIEMLTQVSPDLVMRTPGQRLAGWLGYLYFSNPAVADVANYVNDTHASEQAYFSNPLHRVLRGIPGGLILLCFSLFGFFLSVLHLQRNKYHNEPIIFLQITTLVVFLSIMLAIPLPFQRYIILLVPFSNLWIAYGIIFLSERLKTNREA